MTRMYANPTLRWYSFRWQTGIVLCLAFLASWYFLLGQFKHPMGTGPAGPSVVIDSFQKPWSTNQFALIGLGDSVTEGYGATGKHSYFDLLLNNDNAAY